MDIHLERVTGVYSPKTPYTKTALEGISLSIPSGQFVAVMGVNGSGKTTLVQLICGLLHAASGHVKVGPYDMNKKPNRRRAWRALGYLPQYPEHQVTEDTVFNHIAAGLGHLGLTDEGMNERVQQYLEVVGLCSERYKNASPFQISGGELRRIALAGVLAAEPNILVLDEPTAGLDSLERLYILACIKQIHLKKGITVCYITHRLEEAMEYSDRILVVEQGRLYADLHPSEIRLRWRELEPIGFVKTPLLRFLDQFEKRFAGHRTQSMYKEDQLVSYITEMCAGGSQDECNGFD
ncbi:energy-coupling factor transport system ATP-binding protein [Paenibacillus rhizosphaerae]|uniref:Energy-coupling factor transport system ATP-binding protein n=1 Tax=Paenibacillus rhizosphaerae TaxID=297318 RepID=A0A839TWR0_9BACL|nr:ATP-binding cassette domain-containing protein [Paenibacillus rhizosphaerae]MBB3129858.1 energy-coupling factor transport system ATP-binding protein [Paenibacillus rhizosphaerae]